MENTKNHACSERTNSEKMEGPLGLPISQIFGSGTADIHLAKQNNKQNVKPQKEEEKETNFWS